MYCSSFERGASVTDCIVSKGTTYSSGPKTAKESLYRDLNTLISTIQQPITRLDKKIKSPKFASFFSFSILQKSILLIPVSCQTARLSIKMKYKSSKAPERQI